MNDDLPIGCRIVCDFQRGPLTMTEVKELKDDPCLYDTGCIAEKYVRSSECRTRLCGWLACHLRRIHTWQHADSSDDGGARYNCSRCHKELFVPRRCLSHGDACPSLFKEARLEENRSRCSLLAH